MRCMRRVIFKSKVTQRFAVSEFACKLVICTLVTVMLLAGRPSLSQDINGQCAAGVGLPAFSSSSDYFSLSSSPGAYLGAFDDTEISAEISTSIDMHTRFRKLSEQESRIQLISVDKNDKGNRICAWFEVTDFLPFNATPQKISDPVSWVDPISGQSKSLPNPLPLKAILRSNPSQISSGARGVSFFNQPTVESTARKYASVFGVYYVYATRQTDAGIWYWLAGKDPSFATLYSGWVPEENVLLWESQLSLYFNEVNLNSNIYASAEQASIAQPSGILGKRPRDFNERTLEPNSAVADNSFNIARFPILSEKVEHSTSGQTVYEIGFFGSDDEVGGHLTENSITDSSKIARVQQNVKNVDILFLIDNTLSMSEYFKWIVKAVNQSATELNSINEKKGYDIDVRYAAAVYGDYTDDIASIDSAQFEIVSRFARPGQVKHLEKLVDRGSSGSTFFRDPNEDLPEAGLAALMLSMSDMQWNNDAFFKVIIWIGDHGSRAAGENEQLDLAFVKQSLAENNAFLVPINVSGRYDNRWNFEFIRQGDELTEDGNGMPTRIAHNGAQLDDHDYVVEYVRQAISAMYQSSLVANIALREQLPLEEAIRSSTDLLALELPLADADVLSISQAICTMAFGDSGCLRVKKDGQFMGKGYVRYDERFKNYSYWINLTSEQLDLIQRVLDAACRGFERGEVKRQIENAMILVQNAMGGDTYRNDVPVGVYLRRFFLLPRDYFPSFLESTPEAIEDAWREAVEFDLNNGDLVRTSAIADTVCKSATLLDLVVKNKRVSNPDTDVVRMSDITNKDSYRWTVAEPESLIDFDWEWVQGGENNFVYIPTSFLPSRLPTN